MAKENSLFRSLRTLIDSTGGRRFLITLVGYAAALHAVSRGWITSSSFENIYIYLGGFFIAGNTVDQFKDGSALNNLISRKQKKDEEDDK